MHQSYASINIPRGSPLSLWFAIVSLHMAIIAFDCTTFTYAADNNSREPTLSDRVSLQLNKINEYLSAEQFDKARKKLTAMLKSSKLSAFEQAMAYQAFAYLHAMENEQYDQAIEYFEKALPGFVKSHIQTQKTRRDLGQLYVSREQYQKALAVLIPWQENAEKDIAQINLLIAISYSQLNRAKKAIKYMLQAFALAGNPSEQWYRLLLSLYLEEEDFPASAELLMTMIVRFPESTQYWKRLGAIQLQLGQYAKASASLEIAWRHGLLSTEDEIKRLAKLYLHNENPHKAALILEQTLNTQQIKSTRKNWKLLADALLLARETPDAIQALTKAAELSNEGEIHLQLAQLHINDGRWGQANNALDIALKKGSLRDIQKAHLLRGIALAELGKTQSAIQAFKLVSDSDQWGKNARYWLRYLRSSQPMGQN